MFFSRILISLTASAAIAVSAATDPLEYFVYAPAQTDSGVLARQRAAAKAHLEHANSLNMTGNLGRIYKSLHPSLKWY